MVTAYVDASALKDWRGALARLAGHGRLPSAGAMARIDALLKGNPERLGLREFVALLEEVGKGCWPSGLAWTAGLRVNLPFGSDIGRVTLGCRTLGSALSWLCRFFPLLQDASCLRLDLGRDLSTISYKILDPTIWPRHEDAMYSLGIYARLIRSAVPEAWNQCTVSVEAEQEQVGADLAALVQTSVVHGACSNAIRFPSSIIDTPLGLAPPCEPEMVKKVAAELTRKMRTMTLDERARQVIFAEMTEGHVSQDRIARELGVSSRTLRRHLADRSLSFQVLLDQCRMEFAEFELRTRHRLSLSDIAFRVGYSEHSTFSRAFSRWTGMAPQKYRNAVTRVPGRSAYALEGGLGA